MVRYEHADGLVGVYREQEENSSKTLTLDLRKVSPLFPLAAELKRDSTLSRSRLPNEKDHMEQIHAKGQLSFLFTWT